MLGSVLGGVVGGVLGTGVGTGFEGNTGVATTGLAGTDFSSTGIEVQPISPKLSRAVRTQDFLSSSRVRWGAGVFFISVL